MLRKLDGKALLASKCKGSFHLLLSSMYFFLGGGVRKEYVYNGPEELRKTGGRR